MAKKATDNDFEAAFESAFIVPMVLYSFAWDLEFPAAPSVKHSLPANRFKKILPVALYITFERCIRY